MGLGSIAGVLSGGGALLGALGGGKKTAAQPISGFGSQPTQIKDYMLDVLFPDIKSYKSGSYIGLPKRRINADDLDPVFGSRARVGIQEMLDYKNPLGAQNAAPTEVDESKMSEIERLMGLQALNNEAILANQMNPGSGRRMMDYASSLDSGSLSSLGKYIAELNKIGGQSTKKQITDRDSLDAKNAQSMNLLDLFRKGF